MIAPQNETTMEVIANRLARLEAEGDRLRELVEEAYREGWDNSHNFSDLRTNWMRSNSRAALESEA